METRIKAFPYFFEERRNQMEYKNILFNVEEEIATITFNRPKVLNAMILKCSRKFSTR